MCQILADSTHHLIDRKLLMFSLTIYMCIMKQFVMLDSGQHVCWNSFDLHNLTNTLPVALHNCPAYGSSCQMKVLSNLLQDMLGSNCSQRAYNGPHKPSQSFMQKRASTDQTMHWQPQWLKVGIHNSATSYVRFGSFVFSAKRRRGTNVWLYNTS
jgi:type IV secretory pathway VirB6-like protein